MRISAVALIGALDTKGEEYAFVGDLLRQLDCEVTVIDTGVLGEPQTRADITRHEIAQTAGQSIEEFRSLNDRNAAMAVMGEGAASALQELHASGRLDAVMALGGSNAGYIMSAACAGIPVGVPKLLVSTIAAGDTRAYVRGTDLTLMYSVVDIGGLNRVSRHVLTNAAHACAGMARAAFEPDDKPVPVVAVSMFGVTTPCGTRVREVLSAGGYEVLTFHATGVGGRSLETLIRSDQITVVADMTTTELADDLCGGVCSAGPDRLTAASANGIPQVVSMGALDMVNFGPRDSVPARYAQRQFHQHNPAVTLMRTSVEECAELGRRLAAKVNVASAPCAVLVPTKGFSQISAPGQVFYDPAADAALIDSFMAHVTAEVDVRQFDTDINDPGLATTAAEILTDWLKGSNT